MIDLSQSQWQLALTAPEECGDGLSRGRALEWIDAEVPGTVAGALTRAGQYDPDNPRPLHDKDIWYRTNFRAAPGPYRLHFGGLATIAEIHLNGELVLSCQNMFRAHEIEAGLIAENELTICFRALQPHLEGKGPRARWRTQLTTSQGLRLIRTTLLGHMPGWCPEIHAVGPYRPICAVPVSATRVSDLRIFSDLAADGTGYLSVSSRIEPCGGSPVLICAGAREPMQMGEDGLYRAELALPGIPPWMPHTHGDPILHDISAEVGGAFVPLGRTGFRRLEIERGPDGKGFGLAVNGVNVFARGAVWTNADLLNLSSDRETYRPLLELARDAGMNMLRIGGTMLYEGKAFFDLCDELGILVWQDFQFANYDYPVSDDAFRDEVGKEVSYQLGATQGSPSLAVLCGGSEIYQQGAMMGLPESRWKGPLCEEVLPALCAELRPDVPYVANSPSGGALPFLPNEGVGHYYGVGAYRRPLDDARRANVRFAAECLAFSNIPQKETLDRHLAVRPVHDPRWKARLPRDRGAGWDFEDIRDHYLKTVYGVDPLELRYGDPDRYLELGSAVTGEVMETVFSEWRRKGSSCRGGLVWAFQDIAVGAGWGVIDATGVPKPAYYALKRAFRPVQVAVTDEGTNGLAIHVINDRPQDVPVKLSIACLRDGQTPVVTGERNMILAPHSAETLNAIELIGAFFDVTYAYRFGPPSHDVSVVRLINAETGALIADAFHFPSGFDRGRSDPGMRAAPERDANGNWWLSLETDRFVRSLHISTEGFHAEENWFHLAPGMPRKVRLTADASGRGPQGPGGLIGGINARTVIRFG